MVKRPHSVVGLCTVSASGLEVPSKIRAWSTLISEIMVKRPHSVEVKNSESGIPAHLDLIIRPRFKRVPFQTSGPKNIRSMRSFALITSNTKSGHLSRSSYTKETQSSRCCGVASIMLHFVQILNFLSPRENLKLILSYTQEERPLLIFLGGIHQLIHGIVMKAQVLLYV
ncbi:hypothetical protein AVEN_44869-1 [Araneus ventricosus]|uniref:Uncharacterized protein n=1 Tax=Araneus ventricosus TaxID=182803 RepID=A0A4Y2K7Y9_ARAVE|nr:hypothetical protein AVEN_44869-1 [Araneus ventricosus]